MKATPDYEKDLADIRQMMERSSKFLSLSGWSGILAGIYALIGVFIAYAVFDYRPGSWAEFVPATPEDFSSVIWLALGVLTLTLYTVVFLSAQKAKKRGEKLWNATSKRLLIHFGVPLIAGGFLLLIFLGQGWGHLLAPLSLLFYGLALHAGSNFTFAEMRFLGIIQLSLGLIGCYYPEHGLLLWALGFGLVHMAYGLYLHFKYER